MKFPRLSSLLFATAIGTATLPALADDNAAQAAARAAVLQKLQEMDGADTNTVPAAPMTAPMATTSSVPMMTAPAQPAAAPDTTPAPVAGSGDNAAQAAARAALAQSTPGVSATAPAAAPMTMSSPSAPMVVAPAYKPIVAPALPITADQQAQLQALDAKYAANQISPQDYFTQREAIVKGQ